ncbi:hypothetical protein QEZ54_11425 [Catellatospora sp. KI3]|uniref:LppU/SCO3897 family protein n=1 Tax=Catellatospora sp. KI3 TaxID=3041620 RepID=UPI002482AF25|nr:hypothetical protein [Catellatospora sp. KI3]MDI1461584.1 hypothetical protein [Catellatospora sp. KI3]
MTDGEAGSSGREGRQSAMKWLTIVAGVTGIVASVVTVVQWLESRPDDTPAAVATASAAAPTPTASTVGTAATTGDDALIRADQCVRDVGDAEHPLMKIADCGPGTMRVLVRIEEDFTDESGADAACQAQAPTYSQYYFSTERPAAGTQVVFCLKEQ